MPLHRVFDMFRGWRNDVPIAHQGVVVPADEIREKLEQRLTVIESFVKPDEPAEPEQNACTCYVDRITSEHLKSCAVRNDSDWNNGRTEWHPHEGWLYYDKIDGQDVLTDGDKFSVPAVDALQDIGLSVEELDDIADELADLDDNFYTCECEPPKRFSCGTCGVEKGQGADAEWGPIDHSLDVTEEDVKKSKKTTTLHDWKKKGKGKAASHSWDQQAWGDDWTYGYGGGGAGYIAKDRHYYDSLIFPNGVKVYASSQHTRKTGEEVPSFALYLDDIWRPQCLAFMLPWQDMGLPKIGYKQAAEAITNTYNLAVKGSTIEVGCIGGHGRTGTVLACMAVLAGVPGKDAVKFVRDHYCKHAVESARQEWWVLWFEANMWGTEAPPEPPPTVYKTVTKATTTTTGTKHPTTAVLTCTSCQSPRKLADGMAWCIKSGCKLDGKKYEYISPKEWPKSTAPASSTNPWICLTCNIGEEFHGKNGWKCNNIKCSEYEAAPQSMVLYPNNTEQERAVAARPDQKALTATTVQSSDHECARCKTVMHKFVESEHHKIFRCMNPYCSIGTSNRSRLRAEGKLKEEEDELQ